MSGASFSQTKPERGSWPITSGSSQPKTKLISAIADCFDYKIIRKQDCCRHLSGLVKLGALSEPADDHRKANFMLRPRSAILGEGIDNVHT